MMNLIIGILGDLGRFRGQQQFQVGVVHHPEAPSKDWRVLVLAVTGFSGLRGLKQGL